MDSSYIKTPKYQFSENSVRWRKVKYSPFYKQQEISNLLKTKYEKLFELYENMSSSSPLERRNCEEILNLKHLWALNREDVEEKENFLN
jgi:hypothetical protein